MLYVQESSQKLIEVEEAQEKVSNERRELHQALEMVKENAERQIRELEQENTQLATNIEVNKPPFSLKKHYFRSIPKHPVSA